MSDLVDSGIDYLVTASALLRVCVSLCVCACSRLHVYSAACVCGKRWQCVSVCVCVRTALGEAPWMDTQLVIKSNKFVYLVKLIRFFGNYGFYFRFLSRFFSFFWLFTWCSDLANINACLHEFSFAFFLTTGERICPSVLLFLSVFFLRWSHILATSSLSPFFPFFLLLTPHV